MKRLLVLIICFISILLVSCNSNKLTDTEARNDLNKIKEYVNDDENWNGLYSVFIYDKVYVHQKGDEEEFSFIKPTIKSILSVEKNQYTIIGEKLENDNYILNVKLINRVHNNLIIDEYKVTVDEKLKIEFTFIDGEGDKSYNFYIIFNKGIK